MLIISNNLFGQINQIPSLRGIADSLVVVDVATIREATIKLLERDALKGIVTQQDTIITNQNEIINQYYSYNLYLANENLKLQDSYYEMEKINKSLEKSIKRKDTGLWVLGGISFASVLTTAIFIITNNGK